MEFSLCANTTILNGSILFRVGTKTVKNVLKEIKIEFIYS